MSSLSLRKISLTDCEKISQAFHNQGWKKPAEQYERYFQMQESGTRDIIIAEYDQEFAGYLTIVWKSTYEPFQAKGIPEIVDFNVLKKFQRRGIGSALMDEAERRMKTVSKTCGIGFGLVQDYGAAQILYVKRGYVPDGRGMTYENRQLQYGDTITMDDAVVLHLMKRL